jgi:hypothetical protein
MCLQLNKNPCLTKVSNEVEIAMTWLIDALNNLKENFLRTIIYCNSITDAYIHNFQNVQTSGICFIQKIQPNARLFV